jgi:uncharacterized protein
MRILVISDTHIPRTANDLPAAIYEEIKKADMIMHAGDFAEKTLYDHLRTLKPLVAVYGNMDTMALHQDLKAKEIVEVEGFKIGLIHGHGAPRDLIETVRKEFKGVDAIVFGHSHVSENTVKDKTLFFNPGSPTDKVFTAINTYGILEVTAQGIQGSIIRLE